MRLAIINWTSRQVGGTEDYLSEVIPELRSAGHALAFVCGVNRPLDRVAIGLPEDCKHWCLSDSDAEEVLSSLRQWRPDLLYVHGPLELDIHERIMEVAPAVCFFHCYDGTCISGSKSFSFPIVRPCSQRFGWKCLLHYFPHRCGGRSPVTMLKLFRHQLRYLKIMRKYDMLVTASEHMRLELLRNGFPPEKVFKTSYLVDEGQLQCGDGWRGPAFPHKGFGQPYKLLFIGRMDRLKGGLVLLDALAIAQCLLGLPINLVFAGDGPERRSWEVRARKISARHPLLSFDFMGWLEAADLRRLLSRSDLLVVPSLWPEPFGRVGPQAGLYGLPVAAFDVGGVREWLVDGFNGYLAPGDPPQVAGLAEAIVKCLQDENARLRQGAQIMAKRFSLQKHITQLTALFEKVVRVSDPPDKASEFLHAAPLAGGS